MKRIIKGKFSVKGTPGALDETLKTMGATRMTFDKKFEGDLDATGSVSMMGIMNLELGSGGYVALEKIVGSVEGRKGSFNCQHSSIMNRGKPEQMISVIPDSGTEALTGLRGNMIIDIVDGQHFYTFEYSLDINN